MDQLTPFPAADATIRDLLAGGVVLTAQRLQEAVDEAVTRGRITRRDAEDLATSLLAAGRQQTSDLLRAAGMSTAFPIVDYDQLTAAQVVARLPELSSAELRKVRDYEAANSDRVTVIKAVEKALA